jgi:hypothetical protein
MTLERPRFVPVGAPDHLHFRLDSELIGLTGLTAPQRRFLYKTLGAGFNTIAYSILEVL